MKINTLRGFFVRGIYNNIGKKIIYPIMILRDRIRGVDFYKKETNDYESEEIEQFHYYESTHLRIDHQLKRLCGSVSENDSMIDVGCGKGRMLEFFSKFPFQRVDGLEKNQRLAEIGKHNIRKLGLTSRIFCTDAQTFNNWDQYNYFYFYNPFPEEVMEKCVGKILESTVANPRILNVFYANPTCNKTFLQYGFIEVPIDHTVIEKIWQPYLSGLNQYVWIPE